MLRDSLDGVAGLPLEPPPETPIRQIPCPDCGQVYPDDDGFGPRHVCPDEDA